LPQEDNGGVDVSSRLLLVLNAGSSSIKFSVYEVGESAAAPASLYRGEVDGLGARPRFVARDQRGARLADETLSGAAHDDGLAAILAWIEARTSNATVVAAGHRVVHGGVRYTRPVRVTPEVMRELKKVNYGGLVAIEYEHEGPVEEDVRIEVEYARKLL